jgi:hypothetical protein
MAAFALGTIQCDGTGSLLDKVRVVQADTMSLIQGGFTAGSTTSEASCEAVRLSCNILVERLKQGKAAGRNGLYQVGDTYSSGSYITVLQQKVLITS